jgi:hypothetical protein
VLRGFTDCRWKGDSSCKLLSSVGKEFANGHWTAIKSGRCIVILYVAASYQNDTLEITHIARHHLAGTLCDKATSLKRQPHKGRWLIQAHSKIGLKSNMLGSLYTLSLVLALLSELFEGDLLHVQTSHNQDRKEVIVIGVVRINQQPVFNFRLNHLGQTREGRAFLTKSDSQTRSVCRLAGLCNSATASGVLS